MANTCQFFLPILLQLQKNSVTKDTSSHYTEELLAQALCQSVAVQRNLSGIYMVYAVGKYCSWPQDSDDCDLICGHNTLHTDSQTAQSRWFCIGAFHVYYSRPATRKDGRINTATLGLKSARSRCNDPGCGPNFCCCIADGY